MLLLGRCYGVSNKDKEVKRKTVPFGPKEQDLLEYTNDIYKHDGIKFATYVKKLIRKDMSQQTSFDSRIEQILDEYFKNKNISIEENKEVTNKTNYTVEDKSALAKFIKSN
jgi:hypothetical protein